MVKVVAKNKKAFHDYHILEKVEAGIMLVGTEVKSLRAGNVQIRDAYASPRGGELYLNNLHISEYSHGNIQNHDPMRPRKLLLHKKEMQKFIDMATQKGFTLLALKIYFKNDYAKVELGVGRGKKLHDKRETLKRKAIERDSDREHRIKF